VALNKTQSHGRIGEAATLAKCWMHGIPAYNTAGLRSNFAGSDLIIDTGDPRKKRLVQIKTGYCPRKGEVEIYLTQCGGEEDLVGDKFVADFVVFVNMDRKAGEAHQHDGSLEFEHLTFYVVPRDVANQIYRETVNSEYKRPKKNGERRILRNMAVNAAAEMLKQYLNAWHLLKGN
jgi:hypothetical protein